MVDILSGKSIKIAATTETLPIWIVAKKLEKKYQIINGPHTLTQQSSQDWEKNIYIFGERHQSKTVHEGESITISEFLLDVVFKNLERPVDIFLEIALSNTVLPDDKGDMIDIRNTLVQNPTPNLIIHSSDVRAIQNGMSDFSIIILSLYYYLINLSSHFAFREAIRILLRDLSRVISSADDENLIDFLIFQCDIGKEIDKQLNKSSIHEDLEDFFNSRMNQEGLTKQFLLSSIESVLILLESDYSPKIEDLKLAEGLAVNLIIWQSMILDVYILAKMFAVEDFPDDPSKCCGIKKNIIVYVGNLHAERQRDFLKYLGFDVIKQFSGTEDFIDISEFNQPFFN